MQKETKLLSLTGILLISFALYWYRKELEKREAFQEPLLFLKVWGNPNELSDEDMHSIASTVTLLVANSLPSLDDSSLPLGAEKLAVEEVMNIFNQTK